MSSYSIPPEFRRYRPHVNSRPPAPPARNEHKMIITGVKGSNGKRLWVRCKCMAEYPNVKDNYYNYDPIGEVSTLEEAAEMYDKHVAGDDV